MRSLNSQTYTNQLWIKEQEEGTGPTEVKIYYKTAIIKSCDIHKRIKRLGQLENPKTDPYTDGKVAKNRDRITNRKKRYTNSVWWKITFHLEK